MRTFLAFLLAPCAAPLIYATVAATRRPPTEGPTWIDSFIQIFFVSSLMSYVISLTFGTLAFLVLCKTKRESLATYAGLGALGGVAYFAYVATNSTSATPGGLFIAGSIFAMLGLSVSTCFALIRGVPSKTLPHQSTKGEIPSLS